METISIKKNELKTLIELSVKEEFDKRENFLGFEELSNKEEREFEKIKKEVKSGKYTELEDIKKKLKI